MASKTPQTLKRPVPKHVLNRLADLAQRQQALNDQINTERGQFLQGFAAGLGIDPTRFGLWINDGEDPITYEVLAKADFERRQRLQEAVNQAKAAAPKADPAPRKGEKPLALAEDAG